MNWTPHEIEQAWEISGLVLTNDQAVAVNHPATIEDVNERLSRAKSSGSLDVPRIPSITRRQLRLWLHRNDYLASVVSAINALPEPMKSEALIEWDDALVFERDHPLVSQIGLGLNLDSQALDAAWKQASQI